MPEQHKFSMKEKLPARFGRFVLQDRIGAGGMGVIYRATIEGLAGFEKTVAVKCILPHLIEANPDFVHDLIEEAKLSVLMDHPNIIQVYDLGDVDGQVYISMEHIVGKSLGQILYELSTAGAKIPILSATSVIIQTCRGLEYAHELADQDGAPLGIVHRDISPSNIIVSSAGIAKIIDFGIARAATKLSLTEPGRVKGKLRYMAPEHLSGEDIDRRADVFATGIVLFEMLTGRALFGSSSSNPLVELMEARVPDIRELRSEVPKQLEQIVRKALAKETADRYQTCMEFAEALKNFATPHDPPRIAKELGLDQKPQASTSMAHEEISVSDLIVSDQTLPDADVGARTHVPKHRRKRKKKPGSTKAKQSVRMGFLAIVVITCSLVGAGSFYLFEMLPYSKIIQHYSAKKEMAVTEPVIAAQPKSPSPPPRVQEPRKKRAMSHPKAKAPKGRILSPRKPPTPLTEKEIIAEVQRYSGKFQRCIKTHFDPSQTSSGTLVVGLKIDKRGNIAKVTLGPEPFVGTALGKCIIKVARRLKYRPHADESIEVEFPFAVDVRAQ